MSRCEPTRASQATTQQDATNTLYSSTLIMSSSEENYDIHDVSGDESEGYSPVAKKTVCLPPRFSLLVI